MSAETVSNLYGSPRAGTATALVRRYLDAMQARDLPSARALLASEFRMVFPGGVELRTLEDQKVWNDMGEAK